MSEAVFKKYLQQHSSSIFFSGSYSDADMRHMLLLLLLLHLQSRSGSHLLTGQD